MWHSAVTVATQSPSSWTVLIRAFPEIRRNRDHGEIHFDAAPSCKTKQFLPDLHIVGGEEVVQIAF